jgi:shikimate kinase
MSSQAMKNIVFIGLMGAGKTTIGKRLAARVGRPLVDTDHEIEARSGTTIPVIFEVEGEEGFRRRESKVIADVMSVSGRVVTTGGGAPMDPANREQLSKGYVVYLEAEPRLLWTRLRSDHSRPLLMQSSDPRAKVDELYALRDPVYRAMADCVVSSTRGSLGQVVTAVEEQLVRAGLIPAQATDSANPTR